MHISTRFLTSISTLLLVAGGHAQVVTPNPPPTIIKTAPYTISTPGFYQLGADLTVTNTSGNIITIAASNVTLDFGGHYISGPVNAASQVVGVYANEEGNLTIQNGTVAYCEVGVNLAGNSNVNTLNINQRVSNMLITYCYYIGIDFYRTNYGQSTNNRISYIGGSTVSGANNAYGIYDYSLEGDQAMGNTINEVTTPYSTGGAYGIYAIYSTLAATNNTVSNLTNTYSGSSSSSYGIYNAAFIVGNTVSNCYYGIFFGKYENNLTNACTTPFSAGTNVGGNN